MAQKTPSDEVLEDRRSPDSSDVNGQQPKGTREDGQGLVEYALAIFLMVIVVIVSLQVMGPRIGSIFSRMITIG